MLAAQTSTQLNTQFRVMEHITSAEKDEFHRNQMQEFAIQAEETIDAQRQLYFQEAGQNSEEMKTRQYLGQLPRAVFRIRVWSLRLAIESERHRLPNQESFLSHEVLRLEYPHQQQVIEMQKHVDEAL